MSGVEPRPWRKRPRGALGGRRGWLGVAGALALLLAAGASRGPLREAAKSLASWGVLRSREAERPAQEGFLGPVASQVGYAPRMKKQFSAPRPFRSFLIVNEVDGAVAYRGGEPARSVPTDLAGSPGTVSVGDFSSLDRPGRYRIVTDDGASSHAFAIGEGVFDQPLRAVQRWFYYQRAFTAVEAGFAEGPWVHPSDADKAPAGVVKGWHDAGDLSIYMRSLSTAVFWLLEAYSDFAPVDDDTHVPESGNGVPDLLDEARWGLEWMLSVQAGTGGFRNSTCQEHYGPYGTNTPNSVPPYRPGDEGTIPTARAIGTLAYASAVFRPFDREFADRCLAAARRGYAFLASRPAEDSEGPICPGGRVEDEHVVARHARMYAAAGLLFATGERRFADAFEASFVDLRYDPSYEHMNGFAAQLYLRSRGGDPARKRELRDRLRELAASARADGEAHPFQWATRYHWGSLGAAFTRTGSFNVKACLEDPTRAAADCDQALANVHYLFGRNYYGFCYVSGLAGVTRGRTWAFHHWLAALAATPHDFPGMVAGGPAAAPEAGDASSPLSRPRPVWGYWGDPKFPRSGATPLDGRYTDNDSWSTNEVDVDWQAATLYSLYFARWMARGGPRSAAAEGPRGGRAFSVGR